jgi:hypothetical protein
MRQRSSRTRCNQKTSFGAHTHGVISVHDAAFAHPARALASRRQIVGRTPDVTTFLRNCRPSEADANSRTNITSTSAKPVLLRSRARAICTDRGGAARRRTSRRPHRRARREVGGSGAARRELAHGAPPANEGERRSAGDRAFTADGFPDRRSRNTATMSIGGADTSTSFVAPIDVLTFSLPSLGLAQSSRSTGARARRRKASARSGASASCDLGDLTGRERFLRTRSLCPGGPRHVPTLDDRPWWALCFT